MDYLFLKQEISNLSLIDSTTFDGFRLIAAFLIKFPSVRRGYRDYRWLGRIFDECSESGKQIVISDNGSNFTLYFR